ncbi:hypothetical protein [Paenibacillus sp. FSL R7-0179]|uniref:hypothetical protein n=1 Tax=Paenibacillus sp. FSL R7-0179 TaxID=2921672 RepID=UPI0030F77B57
MKNFFSKYSRVIIILETLLIAGLSLLLVWEFNKPVPLVRDQRDLITHFDQLDLDRITEMIHRFKEGKGDNLTMLQWGVDSGPYIHDFYNDGRVLHWTVDNSRDWAGDSGKIEYVCREIRLAETEEYYRVELTDCENQPDDFEVYPVSFRKDEL